MNRSRTRYLQLLKLASAICRSKVGERCKPTPNLMMIPSAISQGRGNALDKRKSGNVCVCMWSFSSPYLSCSLSSLALFFATQLPSCNKPETKPHETLELAIRLMECCKGCMRNGSVMPSGEESDVASDMAKWLDEVGR